MPYIYDRIISVMKKEIKLISNVNQTTDEIEKAQNKKFALAGKINMKMSPIDSFALDAALIGVKSAAANSIFSFSRNMGKAFYPYITQTLPVVVNHFEDHMKLIRKKCLKSVNNMVMACQNENDCADILENSLPQMLESMNCRIKVADNNELHYIWKHLLKSLRILTGPVLSEKLVADIINQAAKTITLCKELKQKVFNQFGDIDECDEEKQDQFQEEFDTVNQLMEIVMDVSVKLLMLYGDKIEGLLGNGIAPYYYDTLKNKDAHLKESLYSLCFFDTFLEYCSNDFFNKAATDLMSVFVDFSKSFEDPFVLQSAAFGIGVIARRMDTNTFSQAKEEILKVLSAIVLDKNAYSDEDRACATDNAVGAIGKIALFHGLPNDKLSEDILSKFLSLMPLKNDCTEAQAIHKMLLEEIANKNKFLSECNQEIQNQLINALENIKKEATNNPELEILDDKGQQLLGNIL
mmetsp:Transcript_13988/g.11952  ORF Transcript_13988/g.11952 Transcript_13988/m.11952 type:complete len:465 (+) Transcript_13988:1816-3210(+)